MPNNQTTLLDFGQAHWNPFIRETLLPSLANKFKGQPSSINDNYFIKAKDLTYLLVHPFWDDLKRQESLSHFTGEVKIINIMDAVAKSHL